MTRTYCNIIIWAPTYPNRIRSERFYVFMTNGTIRDIKRHRSNIRPSTIERHVSRALANGQRVTFETCKPDFTVSQSTTVQLPRP